MKSNGIIVNEQVLEDAQLAPEEQGAYLVSRKVVARTERFWNPDFDQDALCQCGHPYYRHFDSYEENYPVGCKYCDCFWFKLPSGDRSEAV